MRKVFLIVNNLVLNNIDYLDDEKIDTRRARRPLSIEGENRAAQLAQMDLLQEVSSIYSASFASALATAKYLSHRLDLTININQKLNERKVGQAKRPLDFQSFRLNQEHDFDYKFPGGESFNLVRSRLTKLFNQIMKLNQDDSIAIFTHTLAAKALLANWCTPAYNLDANLILNYQNQTILFSGGINLIILEFNDDLKLLNLHRIEV